MNFRKAELQRDTSHAHTSEGEEMREPSRQAGDSERNSQPQEIAGKPEGRIVGLEIQLQQKENQIQSLQQRLRDLEVSATQARIANETLTFYLERYKRVKDRFLPRGSFRERVCRQIAHRILARPSSPAQSRPNPARAPITLTPQSVEGSRTEAEIVMDPPPDWCDPHQPPVVIAIPNWNRVDLLRRCIESILLKTGYAQYRICVYEQGSTDGSREYLQSLAPHVDAILGDKNIGFVDANNAIIRRYPNWDVVFLNNDTEVISPEWLSATSFAAPFDVH